MFIYFILFDLILLIVSDFSIFTKYYSRKEEKGGGREGEGIGFRPSVTCNTEYKSSVINNEQSFTSVQ